MKINHLHPILNSLNQAQQKAVSAPLGHQLVLAGAGSGKTRVLIHRIGWLIQVEKIPSFNILAVTFTNKAANEMRQRLEALLSISTKALWIGTFHGLSHRLLRAHWQAANLPQTFQILDAEDQNRMIRRLIQHLQLDENRFPAKSAQSFINTHKEEGRLPHAIEVQNWDIITKNFVKIYEAYQQACQRAGVIDFTDLLFKTCQLLSTHEELRAYYQARFRCLLVDEFQDTNTIQYNWLKLFSGEESSVMIVGDDDQSIYGWRGARIENMQRFSQDFKEVSIIRLEQNYRSTHTILEAANALIAQNAGRLGKNLWTNGAKGETITLYKGFNEADEAFFIVNRIKEWQQKDCPLKRIAVLYRSNAQSRIIEEALMQYGIPYRIYGGFRYFDRAEIKDALAYLRLIANPHDDTAFERIINTPLRGIGERTVDAIRTLAKESSRSLWDTTTTMLASQTFSGRTHAALSDFVELVLKMRDIIMPLELPQQVAEVIILSGLLSHYKKEKGEKGQARVENLEELINAAHQFIQEGLYEEMAPLTAFLAYAALEAHAGETKEEDCIQLMTLHSVKGLEFTVVFLSGCEEELFPHYHSIHDPKALEEERRLCYVGVTRAEKKLYMTHAKERRLYGKKVYHAPSRFLQEIPVDLLEQLEFTPKITYLSETLAMSSQEHSYEGEFQKGHRVKHKIFGEGTVLSIEGRGDIAKVTVRFKTVGTKVLIASYLQKVAYETL